MILFRWCIWISWDDSCRCSEFFPIQWVLLLQLLLLLRRRRHASGDTILASNILLLLLRDSIRVRAILIVVVVVVEEYSILIFCVFLWEVLISLSMWNTMTTSTAGNISLAILTSWVALNFFICSFIVIIIMVAVVGIPRNAINGLIDESIGIGGVTLNDLWLLAWVELLIVVRITFLVIPVRRRVIAYLLVIVIV